MSKKIKIILSFFILALLLISLAVFLYLNDTVLKKNNKTFQNLITPIVSTNATSQYPGLSESSVIEDNNEIPEIIIQDSSSTNYIILEEETVVTVNTNITSNPISESSININSNRDELPSSETINIEDSNSENDAENSTNINTYTTTENDTPVIQDTED